MLRDVHKVSLPQGQDADCSFSFEV